MLLGLSGSYQYSEAKAGSSRLSEKYSSYSEAILRSIVSQRPARTALSTKTKTHIKYPFYQAYMTLKINTSCPKNMHH